MVFFDCGRELVGVCGMIVSSDDWIYVFNLFGCVFFFFVIDDFICFVNMVYYCMF